MAVNAKNLIISMVSAGLVILAACASAPAAPVLPEKQSSTQAAGAQPQTAASQAPTQQNATAGYGSSENASATGEKDPAAPVNRVDVIYFHVNQRCVACLCFEQHINSVIDKYFQGELEKGKLTYQVLNLQKPENVKITRKYQAVGSQLFVNVIKKGVDNIQDIQSIWNWKCETNSRGFELKVKNVIEGALNEIF